MKTRRDLLATINGLIDRTFVAALERGVGEIPDRIPYRRLQTLILTSPAFLGLTAEKAARIMGITARGVEMQLRKLYENENVAKFRDAFSVEPEVSNGVDFDSVSEDVVNSIWR